MDARFFHQQVVFASGEMPDIGKILPKQNNIVKHDNNFDIEVPKELAHIEKTYKNGSEDVIINIQDCHSSLSAQYSIVNILKDLLNNYNLSLVAIEGGTGYIDTSILSTFPDKDIKEKTAGGRLEISGSFNAMVSHRVKISGADEVDDQLIGWLKEAYEAA